MTDYGKRLYETLVRVLVFRSNYIDLIAKDSPADHLFQRAEVVLKKFSAFSTSQTSEKNAVRLSSEKRIIARESLRKELEAVSRTAASLGLKQFFMPRDRGDRAVGDVGRIFVRMAEPLKHDFIANHMPDDFIERLKAGIASIERAIEQQASSKSSRKAATTAIATAQSEAVAVLGRLDPIMENLLRDNEPVKSAWTAARRLERAAVRKKAIGKEPIIGVDPTHAAPDSAKHANA